MDNAYLCIGAAEQMEEERTRREDQQRGDLMRTSMSNLSQPLGDWQKLQSYFLDHGKGERYG